MTTLSPSEMTSSIVYLFSLNVSLSHFIVPFRTSGPVISFVVAIQDAKYWFSVIITLLLGLSVTVLVSGFIERTKTPDIFSVQYRKYIELTRIGNIRCRSWKELEENKRELASSLDNIPTHYLAMAQTRYIWLSFLIISLLCILGVATHHTPFPLALLSIASFFLNTKLTLESFSAKNGIQTVYHNGWIDWACYWQLLYYLVAQREFVYGKIDPLKELRKQGRNDVDDLELIRNHYTVPDIELSKKQIHLASLYWFFENQLRPAISQMERGELKVLFEKALLVFDSMKSPWDTVASIDDLLRRVVFVTLGKKCSKWIPELVEDLLPLVIDDKNLPLEDSNFILTVNDIYDSFTQYPEMMRITGIKEIFQLRLLWTFFSAFVAFPISILLWLYI